MENIYTTLLSYFRLKIKYSFGYKGGGLLMPKKKYTGDKPLPANKQKGKKVCTCCEKEKGLVNGFYEVNHHSSLLMEDYLFVKIVLQICVLTQKQVK